MGISPPSDGARAGRAPGLGLAEAVRFYYAGAHADAERACEEILASDPRQHIALLMWSELALGRGDREAVRARLRNTPFVRPNDLDLLLRLIGLMRRVDDRESLEAAARALSERLRALPGNFDDLFALGQASEALGRLDEAISAYDAACRIVPVKRASADTCRANLLLRRAWGDPLPSPIAKRQSPPARGRIAMTHLGQTGRFGNQIFQYGFLRLYGHVHGLHLEVPEWPGRWLFDLDDPYPGDPLPAKAETRDLIGSMLSESAAPALANHDMVGYFQCHTSYLRPYRARFGGLFQPGARLRPMADRALGRLRERGRTLVALHLRRGDYTGGPLFWPAPAAWYLEWLRPIWHELDAPVLYIASDDVTVHREFAEFGPTTAMDIGETVPGAEMYPDFHILAHADLLAISNSSFSVAAAMLNESGRAYVRPNPQLGRLVPFDPWSTEVLLKAAQPG
jgi:hypothetical protein